MNTSSIEDLPTDPAISQTTTAISQISNQGQPNMTLETNEKPQVNFNNDAMKSQFEKELKVAFESGNTSLPSRDIPNNTLGIASDNQTQPNYIPRSDVNQDYIQNYENSNDFLEYKQREINKEDTSDFIYEQMKIPILIACLFFIFQLPFTKAFFYKNASMLFQTDGNYNLYGYLFTSVFFGIFYYMLTFVLDYYSNI